MFFFPCKFLIGMPGNCSLNDTAALKNVVFIFAEFIKHPSPRTPCSCPAYVEMVASFVKYFKPEVGKWSVIFSSLMLSQWSIPDCSCGFAFCYFSVERLQWLRNLNAWIPFCHILIYLHLLGWMADASETKRKDTVKMDSFEIEDQQHKISWKVAFESRRKWDSVPWAFPGNDWNRRMSNCPTTGIDAWRTFY